MAFANYNSLNGMGCGLKTLDDIKQGTILIRQKAEMGIISGVGFYDKPNSSPSENNDSSEDTQQDKELELLSNEIKDTTRRVSQAVFQN